jgi:acetylserotonin N-methyltransferase
MVTGMFPDLTAAPQTDPLAIYRYRDSLYAVDLVAAALSLDFFTRLAAHPAPLAEVCARFGFQERPTDVLMTLLSSNGWVQCEDGIFTITPTAREHLCSDSEWFLGPYYASLHDRPIARDFLEVLRTGKPAGWSGDKAAFDWHKAMEEEDFARRFTAAMDCRGRFLAQALAARLDLGGRRRLLDIGAGSGIYACALAARHPHLEAVAFDQAPVDRIAAALIAERGCSDRVSVATGDMFAGLPDGCDVHLFSNVLHDWDVPEVRQLLAASRAALPAGGVLIVHDAFIHADKTGPRHVAEYSCLLMHSTQGKCYSCREYADLLTEAGFQPGPYLDTVVGRGFLAAVKAG